MVYICSLWTNVILSEVQQQCSTEALRFRLCCAAEEVERFGGRSSSPFVDVGWVFWCVLLFGAHEAVFASRARVNVTTDLNLFTSATLAESQARVKSQALMVLFSKYRTRSSQEQAGN